MFFIFSFSFHIFLWFAIYLSSYLFIWCFLFKEFQLKLNIYLLLLASSLLFVTSQFNNIIFFTLNTQVYINDTILYLWFMNSHLFQFSSYITWFTFPFFFIFLLITLLSIFYSLHYSYNELYQFSLYVLSILILGYLLFFFNSFFFFFLCYECFLIPSFLILYYFAKTRRCVEAAYLMFFWTQFGALCLFLYFIFLSTVHSIFFFSQLMILKLTFTELNFLFLLLICGFGVKFPIWPFYMWLPKAHVEASTNFSIFLSGVLVKFAFLGFLKCLLSLQQDLTCLYFFPYILLGITDVTFKLFYQIDLKKLIAFATVLEMHWLLLCIVSGQSCLWIASFCMLISHALISTNSFFLVDSITRRFKTRLVFEIAGLNYLTPKLYLFILINCLIFMGFPGTLFFIAEFMFFSFFFDLMPLGAILLLILIYFCAPLFFFKVWLNTMFGYSNFFLQKSILDLDRREISLYISLNFCLVWFSVCWQSFLF